jgi:hypothetical protein
VGTTRAAPPVGQHPQNQPRTRARSGIAPGRTRAHARPATRTGSGSASRYPATTTAGRLRRASPEPAGGPATTGARPYAPLRAGAARRAA